MSIHDDVDNLEWLEAWYRRQCDGVWEHALGMNLRSLSRARVSKQALPSNAHDTPGKASEIPRTDGWGLTIELTGTDAADRRPRTLVLDSMDGDWLSCAMTPDRFEGSGDAGRLEQIIGVFRHWVDSKTDRQRLCLALEVAAGD